MFTEKLQELDYSIKSRTDNLILIEKKSRLSNIIILFNLRDKSVSGYLKPNDLISDIHDMAYQYSLFREMRRDLKTFSELSNYDII